MSYFQKGVVSPSHFLLLRPGTGRLTHSLTKKFHSVTTVDISKNMLAQLKKNVKAKNLRITVGNARKLPFKDNSFDSVFSFRFLHLFKEKDLHYYMDEMVRVLKPGGKLVLEFNNKYYGGWLYLLELMKPKHKREIRNCKILRDSRGNLEENS